MDAKRLLCAYCHVPVIGGPLIPLLVYIFMRRNNPSLGFQAKQALVFQILASGITVGYTFLAGVLTYKLVSSKTVGFFGSFLSITPWIVFSLFALIALYAAFENLKGREYRYPLLGSILANA